MRTLSLAFGALAMALPALAQTPIDPTAGANTSPQGFDPFSTLAPRAGWSDDFNRADAATLGPDWTVLSGTWGIAGHRGYGSGSSVRAQHATANLTYSNSFAGVDLPALTGSATTYVGLVLGMGSGADAVLLKVQDNNGDNLYDAVGLYRASTNTAWTGIGTGFANLASPTPGGRLTGYFTDGGDTANLDLDRDFDGVVDEHFQRTGVISGGVLMGTGAGLGTYGPATFDNWIVREHMLVSSGLPNCANVSLDFDNPFVPSGPIASSSPVFNAAGIASVTPVGAWSPTGDVISTGSNDSGQSLVVTGTGTLSVAGVGEALSNPQAGAGFDIVLRQPATAFGLLFVDQINFGYRVELFLGGVSLARRDDTYSGSFPQPPRYWTTSQLIFDRVLVTFPAGTNGVGIDKLTLESPFFTVRGAGGSFPTSTSGVDGVYPHMAQSGTPSLPPNVFQSTVYVPANVKVFTSCTLYGLVHSWSGDAHFVLRAPNGTRYNLAVPPNIYNPGVYGNSCAYNGDYTFVDPYLSALDFPPNSSTGCNGGTQHVPGTYHQYFGAGNGSWPPLNGNTQPNLGVLNVPLQSIQPSPGPWTLECYDWVLGADSGSFSAWELRGELLGNYGVVSGVGGSFPTVTVGSWGYYPHMNQTAAPSFPDGVFTTTVTLPPNAVRIGYVRILDFVHTFSGDVQFVLRDPNGQRYNLACPPNAYNTSTYGNGCDYNGTYYFVDPSWSAYDFPPNTSTACNGAGGAEHTPGVYHQYFGAGNGSWPPLNGNTKDYLGVLNVPLESIPVVPGTWTLECYDWYLGADNGSFTSWQLAYETLSQCWPVNYCQTSISTNGCAAGIWATGNPSVGGSASCTIQVYSMDGQQNGLLFYGLSPNFAPWCATGGTSFLCVKSPLERTGVQNSGGTLGACDGYMTLDWIAFQAAYPMSLGNPWLPGDKVYVQGWFRDPPACKTTNLTGAVELTYKP